MQCAACRAVYSNALDICPQCLQPKHSTSHVSTKEVAAAPPPESAMPRRKIAKRTAKAATSGGSGDDTQAAGAPAASATGSAASTLIEFPGTGRAHANRPQWRKELSERVREIQSRRAREAALEAEQAALRELEQEAFGAEEVEDIVPSPALGLVPSNDTTPLNPLVVAALRRIERARRPPTRPRANAGGGAAAAVARVVKEQYETPVEPQVAPPSQPPPSRVAPVASVSEAGVSGAKVSEVGVSGAEIQSSETADLNLEVPRPAGLVVVRPAPPTVAPLQAEPTQVEAQTELQDETLITPRAKTINPIVEAKAAALPVAPPPVAPPPVAPPPVIPSSVARPVPAAPSAPPPRARVESAINTPVTAAEVSKPIPRRVHAGVIDDTWLERREAEMRAAANPASEPIDDRAPLAARFVGAVIDLVVIAFIASPFAAIIELTSGEWVDPRVAGSMAGILITVMLLYMVVSTGLTGRTVGMWMMSLRVVDVRTAMVPQTGQSIRRAVAYVVSLAALGLGFLYALFDAEGRAAHDHLSGTMVVRD